MDVAAKSGGVTAIVVYDYTAKEPDELDLVKGAIIHSIKQMPGGWWEGTLQSTNKTGMFPDNFVRVVDLNDDNTVVLRDKSATNNGRCKVIYSYVQVNDDELSLAVGDVIEFLGEVEEGWWRGRLKNKIGVFPSNFVKVIEPSPVFASKRPPLPSIATEQTAAPSTTSSASLSSKKSSSSSHRHSFHSSKEDLLSSTLTTTTINNLQHSHHTTAATSHNSTTSTSTSTSNILLPSLSDDAAPILPPKPQREYCRVEFPYTPQNDDELELKVGDIIIIHSTELPDRGWWKGELRGKVGVFPDNFVKLIPASDVSPLNDNSHQQPQPQQTHRTAKSSNLHATTMSTTASMTSTSLSNVAATAKSIIKKSGSTSSTQSSNRKDSFGSRDSLNDILSETGLPSGNVAAQRKSLESKNFDLSSASDAAARIALKKQQQQMLVQQQDMKQYHTNGTSNNISTNIMASSELRKSIENVDDKNKTTPPPVLSKKPIVPNKKSTTVSSVAGNIFSGLKQKVKSVESKLTSAASHDAADGLSSSKMSPSNVVASNSDANIVGMRRAATIAVEDTEFDRVERTTILTDMRAGRVKAPKRRLPSNPTSTVGESNNNSLYVNGSGGGGGGSGSDATHSDDQLKSDDNSTSEELLAKPKPREWEKKKAPWMEELKASQVKKKTSPNLDNQTSTTTTTIATTTTGTTTSSVVERTSKLFSDDGKIISSPVTSTTNVVNNQSLSSGNKMQTASTSQQQSLIMDGHSSVSSFSNYTTSNSKTHADSMSKSLSAKFANETTATTSSSLNNGNADDIRIRPNSLSLRNRSLSPSIAAQRNKPPNSSSSNAYTTSASPAAAATATAVSNTISKPSSVSSVGNTVNNHHHTQHPQHNTHHHHHEYENNIVQKSEGLRLNELELRVEKLEMLVHNQQRTIEELVRALRDETDRVKVLRGELDKYAQCVTQV